MKAKYNIKRKLLNKLKNKKNIKIRCIKNLEVK